MTPIHAYRRQDPLREICQHLGYQGRYVWLIQADKVAMTAGNFRGASRMRYRLLDFTLKSEVVFKKLGARKGGVINLKPYQAIAALPHVADRRWTLLVFLHPIHFEKRLWSQTSEARLKPQEVDLLEGKADALDEKTQKVVRAICEFRGLLTRVGITKLGVTYLEAYYKARPARGVPRNLAPRRFKI